MNYYYPLYKDRCNFLLDNLEDYNQLNDYSNFSDLMPKEDFDSIMREKQNRKNKRYRCSTKIREMLRVKNAYSCENIKTFVVFGTLTLRDDILAQKEDTYLRKISKYLKSHYEYIILNKDYGSRTEREHYHFIALLSPKEDLVFSGKRSRKGRAMFNLKTQDYELGFEPDLEIVNLADSDKVRNYLLKLNNHSNKNTSKSRMRVLKNALAYTMFDAPRKAKQKRTKRLLESMGLV